jgi:hypothetical protein
MVALPCVFTLASCIMTFAAGMAAAMYWLAGVSFLDEGAQKAQQSWPQSRWLTGSGLLTVVFVLVFFLLVVI